MRVLWTWRRKLLCRKSPRMARIQSENPSPSSSPAEKSPIDPVESIRARDAGLDFSSPDDLGSPEDWDFVGTSRSSPGVPRRTTLRNLSSRGSMNPARLRPLPRLRTRRPPGRRPRRSPIGFPCRPVSRVSHRSLAGSSWLSPFRWGCQLCSPGRAREARCSARSAEIAVSGLAITASEVEGRLVENALAGNLLVVSGELENRGPDVVTPGRAVWVQLVSGTGEPIAGATAAAGRAVAETALREWDPDRLRLDLERSAAEMAHRPFRPGARIRFDAVFESIPESAAGWALQAASSPSHPDPGDSPPSTTPLAWE